MPGTLTIPIPLRWRDMDAYGHVNNSEFFTLLEQARIEGLQLLRTSDQTGLVVARHEIEYLHQLTYRPDGVVVRMWCTRIGGAGFDLGYEVATRDADAAETVHARAATTMVTFDFTKNAPRRLTAAEVAALEEMSGPAVAFRRRATTP